MHSLPNLLKYNDFQNVKHLDFEKMSLEELRRHSSKFEKLSIDAKILNSLPDRGDKLKAQVRVIQVSI